MDHRFATPAREAYRRLQSVIPITWIEFKQALDEAIGANLLDPSPCNEVLVRQMMEIGFRSCAGTNF